MNASEQEGDEKQCCPECDSIALRRANVGCDSPDDVTHDYRCDYCGARLDADELETTVTTRSGGPKEGTLAHKLQEGDADDLGLGGENSRAEVDPLWAGLGTLVVGVISLLALALLLAGTGVL